MHEFPLLYSDSIIKDCGWTFLEYFRLQTIPIFSTYYDTTLWQVMVAHISVSQAALQYAAVAFAATHYEYEANRFHKLTHSVERKSATLLYIDAISKARRALIEASSTEEAVRTGFIMSFMLAGTESLRGSREGAFLHLANGLKIAFSRGYQTTKIGWKASEPVFDLRRAVLALINKLEVTIEDEYSMSADNDLDIDNSPCVLDEERTATRALSRYSSCNIYRDISNLVKHIKSSPHDPYSGVDDVILHFQTLENCATALRNLSLKASDIERQKLRFLRLYRQAAHLLWLCKLVHTSIRNTDSLATCTDTGYSAPCIYLKAYFSKLSIIEDQLQRDRTLVTHVTPASLNRFAARYLHILPAWPTPQYIHAQKDFQPLRPLYSEVEQLIMFEEDAIMETGLVPKEAIYREVISALEHGSVSIRYCILGSDGYSLQWVEKKASLWKPVVFV